MRQLESGDEILGLHHGQVGSSNVVAERDNKSENMSRLVELQALPSFELLLRHSMIDFHRQDSTEQLGGEGENGLVRFDYTIVVTLEQYVGRASNSIDLRGRLPDA